MVMTPTRPIPKRITTVLISHNNMRAIDPPTCQSKLTFMVAPNQRQVKTHKSNLKLPVTRSHSRMAVPRIRSQVRICRALKPTVPPITIILSKTTLMQMLSQLSKSIQASGTTSNPTRQAKSDESLYISELHQVEITATCEAQQPTIPKLTQQLQLTYKIALL